MVAAIDAEDYHIAYHRLKASKTDHVSYVLKKKLIRRLNFKRLRREYLLKNMPRIYPTALRSVS